MKEEPPVIYAGECQMNAYGNVLTFIRYYIELDILVVSV